MSLPNPSFAPIDWERATPATLLERIAEAKIVGMGGAGFPTAEKISLTRKHPPNIVIANGMETDPDVNADRVLLEQHLNEVLTGLRIVARILSAVHSYVVTSHKKTIQVAQGCLNDNETVRYLKPTFQNGAERELIQILTGHVVKDNRFPAFDGYLVLNVHTLFAVAEAIAGKPLTKRLVTVHDETRWIDIATPVESILESSDPIRVGCYATGHRPRVNEVLTATVNAISTDKSVHALPCIHCGWCDEACPRDVPVESLFVMAEQLKPNLDAQDALNRCNDCGACVVACPSNIHLLDHVRALRQRNDIEWERISRATQARLRVDAREQRMRSDVIRSDTKRTERMQQQHKWQ
ncbi:MAG: 4Fe-4S dicluster domain-containing protein [Gammaproteobacteria bacterium]|nr:4Fe-4S dicluster domain-containing protein [Gammaproteobacteria bacterium]